MVGHRIAVTAFTILALAVGAGRLAAQEERSKAEGTRPDRLESLAAKLNLNDQQKEEVRKIESDFDRKLDPLEQKLWTLHQEERAAMCKTLTDDQRAKVHEVMRTTWDQELQTIGAKLGLNDEQKERIQKVRQQYEPKFRALMDEKVAKGEAGFRQFRELRAEAHKAMSQVLTDDQRAQLPGILREEFHKWHDAAARREMLNAIADKLGVNQEQREQLQKIQAEYNQQLEQPAAQFKRVRHEEHAAIEKILTPEQRTKLEDMLKIKSKGEEK
jgi:Spy/CpxP family protein refolding chaperone